MLRRAVPSILALLLAGAVTSVAPVRAADWTTTDETIDCPPPQLVDGVLIAPEGAPADCVYATTLPTEGLEPVLPSAGELRGLIVGIAIDGELLPVSGVFSLTRNEDGSLAASASVGCNAYGAALRRDGERLHLVDPATGWISTLMACDATRMRAESSMAAVLTGDDLRIVDDELRSTMGTIYLQPVELAPIPSIDPSLDSPVNSGLDFPLGGVAIILFTALALFIGMVIRGRSGHTTSKE